MYTDGLIERRGEDLEEGIARIAERLQAWRPSAAAAACANWSRPWPPNPSSTICAC
jgi:hypothetical protein